MKMQMRYKLGANEWSCWRYVTADGTRTDVRRFGLATYPNQAADLSPADLEDLKKGEGFNITYEIREATA